MSKEIIDYYDKYHRERLSQGRFDLSNCASNIDFFDESVKSHFIRSGNIKVLDAGCANGLFLGLLTQRGIECAGIDISHVPLQYAKQYTANVAQASANTLPFADNTFDVITGWDTIEHFPDTLKHIVESYRILKPHGIYLFRTPNPIFSVPWELLKGKSLDEQAIFHPSLLSFKKLIKYFTDSGFDLSLVKRPLVTNTTQEKIKRVFGKFAVIPRLLPWELLPLQVFPVYYGIAKKIS